MAVSSPLPRLTAPGSCGSRSPISGRGLPKDMALLLHQDAPVPAPGPESKGLGLWTIGDLVRRLGGRVDVEYPGVGTRVVVTLPVGLREALHVAA